jgi:predicted RNase H-like HicB family nuclease
MMAVNHTKEHKVMQQHIDSLALCDSIIDTIEDAREVRDTLAAAHIEALISEELTNA